VPSALAGAVVVLALLTLAPGTDTAVVVRATLDAGFGAGVRTAVGVAAGLTAWGLLAVVGLAGLLAASAESFTVVKIVGAAYLVVLGLRTLWTARATAGPGGEPGRELGGRPGRGGSGLRAGLLTNLLNPKIAVFYTGLLPQLAPPGMPRSAGMALLVLVHVGLSLLWLGTCAGLLTRARTVIGGARARVALQRVTGVTLLGLGARLAVATR